MDIDIIKAESDLGVTVIGSNQGPSILMENIKTNHQIYTVEKPNVVKEMAKENKAKNLKALNCFNEKLYRTVQDVVHQAHIPLTIGGDHSIAIATALASIEKYQKLGIIWFDAHGDFNTFQTTETGNLHGLPLAVITGYERKELANFHKGNFYPYENTVIVGARDLDKLELENLKNAHITVFSTEDIQREGIKSIVKKAIDIASSNTLGIHISYDIDLIDCNIAPGVSVPVKDGINKQQAMQIVEEIMKVKEKIKSIDVVEFNPLKDIDKKTEKIVIEIISQLVRSLDE